MRWRQTAKSVGVYAEVTVVVRPKAPTVNRKRGGDRLHVRDPGPGTEADGPAARMARKPKAGWRAAD
jgi:hypothetical protein